MRPHPQDTSVADSTIRNLATVPAATVAHIVKYITGYPSSKKGSLSTLYLLHVVSVPLHVYM